MFSRRQILRAGVVGGSALIFPPAMAATRILVRSQAELTAALAKCRGGEDIEVVAPITGGTIGNVHFPAERPVTIRGRFLTEPQTDSKFFSALEVANCSGLRFADCDFEGFVRDRYDRWGRVLTIHESSDVAVERSRIGKGWQGIWAYQCERLSISDCDIAGVGPFGMQFATIDGFTARRNAISDFNIDLAGGEHSDAIMFEIVSRWSPNSAWAEAGSKQVLIEDNFILGDPDNRPQGIFFRDIVKGPGKFVDVTIRGNDLWGTMWGGIALESCHSLVVENNDVRCLTEAGRPVPGGRITQSNIRVYGEEPRSLAGNSASIYAVDEVRRGSKGVREVGCVPYAEAQAAFAKWRADRAAGKLPSQTR